MKYGTRWGLAFAVASGLFLILYFGFASWPLNMFGGWGYHPFAHEMWGPFPFGGFLLLFVLGFVLLRLLFPANRQATSPQREGWSFCPHCGGRLRGVEKHEEANGERHVSPSRT